MANNKLHGYNPDPSKEVDGNRLDRLNPREFRMGMDYELTAVGLLSLSESTEDDRRKATETVLKNITEHGGYYSNLVHYETHFRNTDKKPAFKKWLAEQGENEMQEVDKKYKTDKMTELKEAIKREIKNLLSESNSVDDTTRVKDREDKRKSMDTYTTGDDFGNMMDKKPSKKDVKGVNKGPAVTARKAIDDAKKDLDKAEADRKKRFEEYKKQRDKAKDDDGEAKAKSDYVTDIKTLQDTINDKKAEIKKLTASLTDISEERKVLRREVAKTMMDKDTHMEILKIVKEAGVNLREGSDTVKMYYEIAKTAYQEGFMKALDK
tara:strand:- start:398 stop:1363 length:966 start_codon:yes stop_codon:yes gene_type:complete